MRTTPTRNPQPNCERHEKETRGKQKWKHVSESKMQIRQKKNHKKKDIGIHKSPPIDMKITEARKLSHIDVAKNQTERRENR